MPSINETKDLASVTMLGVVCLDKKRKPQQWFLKGLRIEATEYLHIKKTVKKPWTDATYL